VATFVFFWEHLPILSIEESIFFGRPLHKSTKRNPWEEFSTKCQSVTRNMGEITRKDPERKRKRMRKR
jgi:hypothetical protein